MATICITAGIVASAGPQMSHVTFSRRAAAAVTVNISHLWELCAGLSRTTTRRCDVQCFPVCCLFRLLDPSQTWVSSDVTHA